MLKELGVLGFEFVGFFFFFFFFGHTVLLAGSQFSDQGLYLGHCSENPKS